MAQPPPRKGAYNKFVVNLHKDQTSKLQAKNQQELDLLDDIRNFMKQKAAIEKHYAEGLLKLSSVYGTKKIAAVGDVNPDGVEAAAADAEHNIYNIWRHLLDENEKIAKARLAAVQVFQDQISEDAKNLRSGKNMHAKKSLDRLNAVQKDVQQSVSEVDRTKMLYYTEESDAIDMTSKAAVADERAKGKKRDVISLFQSKSALKSKAGKLSAKQEESDIKSTGARNDYLLSLETANAHQDRYFHYELQCTVREMEGGIYEKMSTYLGTLARTELLTCSALQNSYNNIKQQAERITREYNYRCYLKSYTCLGDHVQYAFEAVEGDTVSTITPSEHDGGYSLNYEARSTAGKLNQAVRTIRAFKKRIKACQNHKAAGLKSEPNIPNGQSLDDAIEELELAIRTAETDKAKSQARLNKLREGGVPVDEYLDKVVDKEEETPQPGIAQDWGSSATPSKVETPMEENGRQVEAFGEQAVASEGWAAVGGEWGQAEEEQQQDWSGTDWSNQQQPNGEVASWSGQASVEQPEPPVDPAAPATAPVIDPNADIWKAVVLFTFQANNEDEINITENEQVDIMVKECDEEGWVMVRNSSGQKGYAPTNYLEVFASETLGNQQGVSGLSQPMQTIPENAEPPPVRGGWGGEGGWAGQDWGGGNQQQDTGGWTTGRGAETETEGESETEDEGPPPGMALPPPPPPQISVEGAEGVRRPVSIQFGSSMESEYCKGLYNYSANGKDELSFKEDDVIHIVSRSPNGVDDGWWMGELNGLTGLFPSIVVEECQANGDDWSPDVSMTECSETEDDMPCFGAPPSLPPLPPAPPGVTAPVPAPPQQSAPPPPVAVSPPSPPSEHASPPTETIVPTSNIPPPTRPPPPTSASVAKMELEAPGLEIKITNPTPTVETAEELPEKKAVAFHVEDKSFSLKMSSDKVEQYQSTVPVEVTVVATVEPPPRPPSPPTPAAPTESLGPVQCVVTAPTPRSGSPEEDSDQEKLFPITSCSSATEDDGDVVGAGGTGWTDSEHPTNTGGGWADTDAPSSAGTDWAAFPDSAEKKEETGEGGWADFGGASVKETNQEENAKKQDLKEAKQEQVGSKQQPETGKTKPEQAEAKPVAKAPMVTVTRPSRPSESKKEEVPHQILSDLADSSDQAANSDSDSEEINTALQQPAAASETIVAESSSDSDSEAGGGVDESESEVPQTEDDRKRAESSETESDDGPDIDTSRDVTPAPPPKASDIRLPPENLDSGKLKKLETMKESAA